MDWKTTEYKKVIAIKPEQMEFIEQTRGKKSRAGKLNEIIEFYKQSKNL